MTFEGVRGYLGPEQVFDAEEYFQHREDARLGRWRWSENPHLVVYADGDRIAVVDERTGGRAGYSRSLCGSSAAPMTVDGTHAAAHAYYEAHPDRKPWEDAKPGEVWVLSTADGECGAYAVMTVRESGIVFESHEYRYLRDDTDIESARRIWPEDAS